MTTTLRFALHPTTRLGTGSLYGGLVHPRRIPLRDEGIAMVADTHRTQLRAIGFDLATLGALSVLECGGTGRDALAWARLGAGHVTHVDLSEENPRRVNEYCESRGIGNLTSIQGDLLAIDLPAQGFDIVRSRGVTHHLADPGLGLARYARWTRLGGLLHFNAYRGGTFYYYGVKLIRELIRQHDLPEVVAALERLRVPDAEAGILLDDFFVPHMHTASPAVIDADLRVAGLTRLWPDRTWPEVDHDVRYPDMPEKTEHLQYWLRKQAHHDNSETVAARMQYHGSVDDIAVGRRQGGADACYAAFQAFQQAAAGFTPARRAEALIRIYTEHHYRIATVAMPGEKRHRRLADVFRREL